MFTLASPARCEVEIKRSRFIAQAARVETVQDTLDFYESVADPGATHNCWAWKLAQQYRFNDDGEPASTAGRPILATIEGKGLDQVMIVVTRHYGGIKLGAGGLVRAYSGTAARCLDQAEIEEVRPELEIAIQAGFCWTGQVYTALESFDATKLDENFAGGGITIRARITASRFDDLQIVLRDATRGEVKVRKLKEP
jgi:uncharacterized YigZ family protein